MTREDVPGDMTMTGRSDGWCIDLNGDVGELVGPASARDAGLLESLSSANVACGVHAGDPESMRRTAARAIELGAAVGAHPGLPDREGFGRRRLPLEPERARDLVVEQVEILAGVVGRLGGRLAHVKPHGALYVMAAADQRLADAVASAVRSVDPGLVLFGLSGSALVLAGRRAGLRTASEVFADRGYRPDGSLVPRGEPGAILDDADLALARAVRMVEEGRVASRAAESSGGETSGVGDAGNIDVVVVAETLCVHGDEPGAAAFARRLRAGLEAAGIRIASPGRGPLP